jgi:septum formation protein
LSARLILASASLTRQKILAAASVPFETAAPNVNEGRIKDELLARGAKADMIASTLAEQKALDVSGRVKNTLVLGADQVLVCEGKLFSKAENLTDARETLKQFRGRKHELISAMALVRNESTEWRHVEIAELWVRDVSDAFLDEYLEREGGDILGSVGCYRIEGRGAQLFEKVMGDQFTIRGLPLFPLLGVLREKGVIPA